MDGVKECHRIVSPYKLASRHFKPAGTKIQIGDVEIGGDRVVVMAAGDIVADGPTSQVLVASPAFAPQVAKILSPLEYMTVDQVRDALATAKGGNPRRPGPPGAGAGAANGAGR